MLLPMAYYSNDSFWQALEKEYKKTVEQNNLDLNSWSLYLFPDLIARCNN